MNLPYTIYNKGQDDIDLPYVKRDNVGREAETYLHHIIENYDSIDGPIAFLQGDPFGHTWSGGHPNRDAVRLAISNFSDGVVLIGRSEVAMGDGSPWQPGLPISDFAKKIGVFREDECYLHSPGAQYVVSKERIKSKPIEFWKNALDVLMSDLSKTPWAFERLWFSMFTDNE